MKKIILSLSALVIFLSANAQDKKTELWPNGAKKSEGIVIGASKIDPNAPKEVQASQSVNVIKDGKWIYWYENGTVRSEEFYNKGIMTGNWKAWYDNGQIESDLNFTTGKASYYFKSGSKQSEGSIADGMVNTGRFTGYFESGKKNYEGSYTMEGKKDGNWAWYDENGKLTTVQVYKNGELVK